MPYKLKKFEDKWKVCDPNKCFSKKALPLKQAQKQRIAIALSESRKTGKQPKTFFA